MIVVAVKIAGNLYRKPKRLIGKRQLNQVVAAFPHSRKELMSHETYSQASTERRHMRSPTGGKGTWLQENQITT